MPQPTTYDKEKMDNDFEHTIAPVITSKEGQTYDVDGETTSLGPTTTRRGLKNRHAIMIGIGGTIGTGLFVGAGSALRMGGPVFLLLAYLLMSGIAFSIVTATSEMSSYLPVKGSGVSYLGKRMVSPSLGFAMGWLYWYVWAVTVPAEITAAALVIDYWNPPVSPAVWISIFIIITVAFNFMPVSWYGETEFWFAGIKVCGIIGLLIMSLVLVLGGGPKHDRLGFRYWKDPGPVNEYIVDGAAGRYVAFISTATFSIFAFMLAPELLVVAAGEMRRPRQNLPKVGRNYIIRLILFYVLGAFFLGLIVPSNDPDLVGGKGAASSPWAVGARRAGIRGLDSVINVVILTSAASAGNASMYTSSRSLYTLALMGSAPRIFLKCNKRGVPYMAVGFTALFSALAYLTLGSSASTVFTWIVNLLNTAGFIGWICCCVIYLRFRKAINAQGLVGDLPYRSRLQPYVSYFCLLTLTFLLLQNGLGNFMKGNWNTASFVTSYIGVPLFLTFYFGHKLVAGRQDAWVRNPKDVDLVDGLEEILAHEAEEAANEDLEAAGSRSWKEKFHLSRSQ